MGKSVGAAGHDCPRVGARMVTQKDRRSTDRSGNTNEQGKGCGQQNSDQYAHHLKWPVRPPQVPPHCLPPRRGSRRTRQTPALRTTTFDTPHRACELHVFDCDRQPRTDRCKFRRAMRRRYDGVLMIPGRARRNRAPQSKSALLFGRIVARICDIHVAMRWRHRRRCDAGAESDCLITVKLAKTDAIAGRRRKRFAGPRHLQARRRFGRRERRAA
jgi:hypothetical protein